MRQIKFRAFLEDEMIYSDKGQFYLRENGFIDVPSSTGHEFYLRSCPLMQFTGLLDRNGKEIYDGDVVKILRGHPQKIANPYVVEYINDAFQMMGKGNKIPIAFVTYAKQCVDNCLVFDKIGDFIEVIGNIHEHSSLLE